MNRLLIVLGLLLPLVVAPRSFAQTAEMQKLVELQLRMEKAIKEAQQRHDELSAEFKKLQSTVKDLKDQVNKQKGKGWSGTVDAEKWQAKLAEAEARARLAEQRANVMTDRAKAALKEADSQAVRAELIQQVLEEKIRRLEKELGRGHDKDKGKDKDKDKDKDPDKNPKKAPVETSKEPIKGQVIKVDKDDRALVEIDLGRDHGIKGGQTLDIFRLAPQPMYLGSMRILQVRPDRSVGRVLVVNPLQKEIEIKIGDYVAGQVK